MRQELSVIGPTSSLQAEITSGTSNGSVDKKEVSPDSQEVGVQSDHTKETTPSTSKLHLEFLL